MNKISKKEKMYQEIEKHGANLNAIFNTQFDNVTLCKKLRRLEIKFEQLALDYCNGKIDSDEIERESAKLFKKLSPILWADNKSAVPVFFNRDPRGYALKIDDEYIRTNNIAIHKDWGGYGILAPDFNETN